MTDAPLPLTFVRDLLNHDETRQQHARRAIAKQEIRVFRGVYSTADEWQGLDALGRYRALVQAVAQTRRSAPVLSHWSAAALHGLPLVGSWPRAVHLSVSKTSGARSGGRVIRHAMSLTDEEIVELRGLRLTSLARTIVDLAAVARFPTAVVMADHALHAGRFNDRAAACTREDLEVQWERRMPFAGFAKAREVIEFADGDSESPLESLSRANMRLIGCPSPVLQAPFSDHAGFIGYVDFYWPELSMVGEADGEGKYLDPALRGGRTVEQVLLDQSKRENRLRALNLSITRWGWDIATDPAKLRAHLSAAGLPVGVRPRPRP